jgi:hypothetical protein
MFVDFFASIEALTRVKPSRFGILRQDALYEWVRERAVYAAFVPVEVYAGVEC